MSFETERVEFKQQFTEEIYKEVIAFANTDGGKVYIGVDNEGHAIGLSDIDNEYTRITNGIRDAISPDVTMFVKSTIQANGVLCLNVSEGVNKPYYLRKKGLKPGGVYVRQGTSSAPASFEQIRQMIKESDGDLYEEMRSMEQSLTFNSAETSFKKYGITFGKEKFRALGMTKQDGELYTNLAYILSDQCAHTTKVAVFGDNANTIFKDSKEFGGSVFKQLDDTFAYLMLCNKTISKFEGLERIEKQDYPLEAIREALLNAMVHRDYSFSGSIIINVNEREMEFISIGGLLPGLSPEDIRSGISQPRNKNLAEVFHRLHLIESYGTGIRKIFALYAENAAQPRIEITPNTFKMVLPNKNTLPERKEETTKGLTLQMKTILNYINEHGQITDAEIEDILGLKKTRAFIIAKQMRDMGLIYVEGRGEKKKYFFNNFSK